MNAKERVSIAMRNGVPDRVPFIPQICHPHAIRMLGMDYESTALEVIRNPGLMNKLTFECGKLHGVDGIRAWIPPDPLEVEEIGGIWYGVDPVTGKTIGKVDFDGGASVVPSEEATILNEDDVESIPVVPAEDILKSGGLNGIRAIIDEAGEDCFVISGPGAFSVDYLTTVRGKAQAMMDLIDSPDFCHRMMERALEVCVQKALALAEVGVDALLIGETFGGVISPAQFKEFSLPYMKRFVEALRGRGPLIYLHICGNSTRILEMMADTGVDCIEPLDPLGGVEVKDAKKRVGSRVALMGGVSTVKLATGTLREVIDDCRRCLDEGAPGGGYILAAGDMLPTETSREKVAAMRDAALHYQYH